MSRSASRSLGQIVSRYGLLMLAVLLASAFSIALPRTFPTILTARSILDDLAITAIVALAEMVVVVIGEFDLSVGYLIGLLHILVLGYMLRNGMPWGLAVVCVLLIGAGVGLANGLLVHVAKIDSFIATLGTGTLAYAAANWYTQGQQVTGPLPTAFTNIYTASLFGIPAPAYYVLVLALVLWILLDHTPTGRYLYALGGNRRAAELTGIPSRRYVIGAFMLSGTIVAFAGVILASRLRLGSVSTGPDYLLPVFVGAMLGSTTIKPGRPNAWGTVIAVALLSIGIAGFEQIGGGYFVTPLFNGSTLIVGVGVAGFASRRIRRPRSTAAPPVTTDVDQKPSVTIP